ncbi:L-alanine-DL-glutamate epimerase-like enolase superfamily enzyme [Rhodococcus rhodochrous J45]|uniref:L-alanine-DL-glutamate epimerase-like enolase superfamily enzyme n=1 Tax=Rhodococcus rhodochrous J45 TaxID=935266 RepID=A0A562E4T2_RHORH|nr:enolase C-terminal domain-like protein [Rhodococcus rhodochrous]TWH16777.1 L-alanine-DL-glutamate epimerase-like enolase superfamily enzyme [Rhodococcus rhodochrous J45]
MTVIDVTAAAYTIPTDTPEADGTLAWDSTTVVLVHAHHPDGVGVGWTYAPAACVPVVTDLLAPIVVGRSVQDVPGMHEDMVRALRNAGRPGIAGCALSAVDVALWDLKARLASRPLHRMLGALRDRVPVYGSGGFTTYDDDRLDAQLRHWVHEQHIPRVKIKIAESRGTATPRDLHRIRRAREAIGDAAELFVDANGGYTAKQAVRVMDAAADCDVRWLEEPVSSDDLDGLRRVREAVRAEVAAVAAAHGLDLSAHCAPHLHVHAAATIPHLRHLEWFHDHVRIETRFFDGALDPAGGSVRPRDDTPGHGLTPKLPDLDRFRVR